MEDFDPANRCGDRRRDNRSSRLRTRATAVAATTAAMIHKPWELAMGCPTLFLDIHATRDLITDEEIDAIHERMLTTEGGLLDEVMQGDGRPPRSVHLPGARRSVLPEGQWELAEPTPGRYAVVEGMTCSDAAVLDYVWED
jgi:hypothetical protein